MVHAQGHDDRVHLQGGEGTDNADSSAQNGERKCIKCQNAFVPERPNTLICAPCKSKYTVKHEKVKCEVCGKMLIAIKNHLRVHGMTPKDYVLMYPGKPMKAKTLRDVIVHGKPRMPTVNFCTRCGNRFEHGPGGSFTLCGACIQKEKESGVECQVCHERFKWITHKHLKTHGLDMKSYEQTYGKTTKSKEVAEMFERRGEAMRTQDPLIVRRFEQLQAAGAKPSMVPGVDAVSHGVFVERAFKSVNAEAAYAFWLDAAKGAVKDAAVRGGDGALWSRGPPPEPRPKRRMAVPLPVTERDFRMYNALSGLPGSDAERLAMLLFKVKYLPLMREGSK